MSVVRMDIQNTDYDAAQALLDLQGNIKPENPEQYVWRGNDGREDMERAAKLFWNCFISSKNPITSNKNILESDSKTTQCPRTQKAFQDSSNRINTPAIRKENSPGFYRNYDRKIPKKVDGHLVNSPQRLPRFDAERKNNSKYIHDNAKQKVAIYTREVGTQTEECYFNPNIELMETTIKKLWERIQTLELQLKDSKSAEQSKLASSEDEASFANEDIVSEESENDCDMSLKHGSVNESNASARDYSEYSREGEMKQSNYQRSSTKKRDINTYYNNGVLVNHNVYTNYNDLVPIGDGHATVSSRILKHINWRSYTSATRKLLTAVFSRRILATHSLTGKPSPAFPNKPAKKKLDPALVNDIVQTVVERCSVPENVVRTSITTKCADESKMFRTRQKNNKKRHNRDRENVSPITSESEAEKY